MLLSTSSSKIVRWLFAGHKNYARYYKVSGHSSNKAGTLVGCATSGEARFDVNFVKTGERFADISGIGGDCQPHNFPITGHVQDQHGFPVAMIPQLHIMERGVLFSVVVMWKLTRLSWIMVDLFMLLGNRGLRKQ